MSVLFAILLFSFLIFIHEMGHFVAAKLSGVQVNEFSMFMGPALFKKQIGETLYSIRCIPFGGYCAMEGENEDTENPRAFMKAAWWKKLIILAAGSFMNFVTGLALLLIVFAPAAQFVSPVISSFEPECTLNQPGGLEVGDRILKVDGERIYVDSNFSTLLYLFPGETHDLVVERDGEKVELNDFPMEKHAFPNEDGTTSERYGFMFTLEDATFGNKLKQTWYTAVDTVRTVRLSMQMLFTGQAGLKDMAGPVGIVQIMSDTAEASPTTAVAVMNMLYLGSFIAINLAVMNMLPIPALDGGRIFGLLITMAVEKVTKKKIDPKYEMYIHGAGMVLLLGLMGLILFKDIFTIFKG